MNNHDPFSADASVGAAEGDQKAAKSQAPAPTPAPAAQPEQPSAPSGTSKEILSWVGNDKAKADAALQREKSSDSPRKGLVSELQEMLKK